MEQCGSIKTRLVKWYGYVLSLHLWTIDVVQGKDNVIPRS